MYGFNQILAFVQYFGYTPFWERWTEKEGWVEDEMHYHNYNSGTHENVNSHGVRISIVRHKRYY